MSYTAYRWGPGATPAVIRQLLLITALVAITSALLNSLFVNIFDITGPQSFLSLSPAGIEHGYLWQPITYLFVQSAPNGVDVFFLITLVINLYILWILATTLQERIGTTRFLLLYLLVGALAGLTAIAMMGLTGNIQYLAGPSAAILAVFTVWTMCNPDSTLLLFFLLPIRTSRILAILLVVLTFIYLVQADFVNLSLYLSAILYGYLFGILVLRQKSPFAALHPLDNALIGLANRLIPRSKKGKSTKSKVYDLESGQPVLDDDAFVDEMLTKISQKGEGALSNSERRRMEQISQSKRKK